MASIQKMFILVYLFIHTSVSIKFLFIRFLIQFNPKIRNSLST